MLILGSTSPRRKQLLESAGIAFVSVSPLFDESNIKIEHNKVDEFVKELAKRKAESLSNKYPDDVVLAADTIVVIGNEILGKPKDESDAVAMLNKLNGKKHFVYTGVAISYKNEIDVFAESAAVYFNQMSEQDIAEYVQTNEPMDKAGAYAIQGIGSKFIKKYEGDFHTIMGLPLKVVLSKLKKYPI